MSLDIGSYISELRHTVTVAGLNHDIWWVYKSKDTRPAYIEMMNRYSLFFQTSIHAHFVALLVALYRLYETKDDTFNIPSLLKILKEQKALAEATLQLLDGIYKEAKPLWIKVSILRNNAFGHRSVAQTVEQVFTEAGVTPDELRDLMEMTWDRVNTKEGFIKLTAADTKTAEPRRIYFNDDLQALFRELGKIRRSRHKAVFTYRGKPIDSIRKSFKEACTKAEVQDFRIHDLRHTFNTNMRKAGVDRSVIMKITVHKTTSMFERYNTVDSEDARSAMDRYEGFLRSQITSGLLHALPEAIKEGRTERPTL